MSPPLFIADLAALKRKLADPPPLLAKLYARFRNRMAEDSEFRRHHVYLPALLGEPAAIEQAKRQILELADDPLLLAGSQDSLDGHIWCVTPRALRLAAYYTWLDIHGAWSAAERGAVAAGVMEFFHEYVVPVLRARVPAGHNQQLSMTFCATVAGHVFAGLDSRATSLDTWARAKFEQSLGLMPASGYSGEGSTYQSDVVSPLAMWAGLFLEQLGDDGVWNRRWEPNNARLADTLRMEADMGSYGGLLPPWDQYGWFRVHHLAPRVLWAKLCGDANLLAVAEAAWDEPTYFAWVPDDRLWTILCWPQTEAAARQPVDVLSGWSRATVGAAIEHRPRKLRVMAAWDRCAGSLQSIGRGQVNPNHLMIEEGGEPITADGCDDGCVPLFSADSMRRTIDSLSAVEKDLLTHQYGSPERWLCYNQQGLLGAACAIVIDGYESWFPRQPRQGRLIFERRTPSRHTFSAEAADYYRPDFDVTHMRRTLSMGTSGVIWIIDQIAAESAHDFAWRLWLRPGARRAESGLQLKLSSGVAVHFAWLAEADGRQRSCQPECQAFPSFPQNRSPRCSWPDKGSERWDLVARGRSVRFVTCVLPEAADALEVRPVGAEEWEAAWPGGAERFALPAELKDLPDSFDESLDDEMQSVCDLDEMPFELLDEPDERLLAMVETAPLEDWRRTLAAMQTLSACGNRAFLPLAARLLEDTHQNYTVNSVAAWCLGRAGYAPACAALERMAASPEDNTAARARWALKRLTKGSEQCDAALSQSSQAPRPKPSAVAAGRGT